MSLASTLGAADVRLAIGQGAAVKFTSQDIRRSVRAPANETGQAAMT